ncbi:LysE family translocator [Loktanella sp. IMCC34160]|uniref:LysE family translocator n=1 Tax=Loktanella sp. IMCC34160 TaxID=2510646 RepID=UPI00101C1B44|nr:LysE family translocator [Loktanella sp. IMCC34160]RYG91185.1 LysE family translocator [Loktanella sp. IMCC34160]
MTQTLLPLLVFLFPLAYSPGPGNLFFAANGARFGLRATLPANAGYHVATWVVTVGIGLGFSALLDTVPALFRWIGIAGALYVLWLALGILRAGLTPDRVTARVAGWWDGAVLLLLNPKAYVIIGLMFSQFLAPTKDHRAGLVLFIATVFTLNNLLAFLLWTIAGDSLARSFRNPAQARWLTLAMGGALLLVGLWMLRNGVVG